MHDIVVSDSHVGIPHSSPSFNGALWKFVHSQGAEIKERKLRKSEVLKHFADRPMPPVAPAKSLAKEVKMMSMNPSVWGNHYGVLGSS